MKKTVLFRVKGGPSIGFGHIARSRVLVKTLQNRFGVRAKLSINSDKEGKADIVVLDYPGAKKEDTKAKRVIVMDDLLARKRFVIIDDSIKKASHKIVNKTAKRVLVSMGGADPYELTLLFLQYIEEMKADDLIVDVIVGPYFSNVKGLEKFAANTSLKINLHKNVKKLNPYIKKADLAIIASGVTMHECAAARLPALVICHWPKWEMFKFRKFMACGTARSLGHYTEINFEKFRREFSRSLDYAARSEMLKKAGKFNRLDDKIKIAKLILNS